MIDKTSTLGDHAVRPRSAAGQFAGLLQSFYTGLVEQGVPEHMAALVRQLEASEAPLDPAGRKIALVVERNEDLRDSATLLLEETGLAVMHCVSAEAALTLLRQRGDEVAFVFADEDLAGLRDGFELARVAGTLWPGMRIVVTTTGVGQGRSPHPAVITIAKPWQALDLVAQAREALDAPEFVLR